MNKLDCGDGLVLFDQGDGKELVGISNGGVLLLSKKVAVISDA